MRVDLHSKQGALRQTVSSLGFGVLLGGIAAELTGISARREGIEGVFGTASMAADDRASGVR